MKGIFDHLMQKLTRGAVLNELSAVLGIRIVAITPDFNENQIQEAMDSEYPVFFMPGMYLLTKPVTIRRPKSVYCFGHALGTAWQHSDKAPVLTKAEQVRFVAQNDCPLFIFKNNQIYWQGGFFDASRIPMYSASLIHILMECPYNDKHIEPTGWSGEITDATFDGPFNRKTSTPATGHGVLIDFKNSKQTGMRLTHWKLHATFKNLNIAFEISEPNLGYEHSSNTYDIQLNVSSCRQSLVNHFADRLVGWVNHQADFVFKSPRDALETPALFVRGKDHILRVTWDGFAGESKDEWTGWSKNHLTADFSGAEIDLYQLPPSDLPIINGQYGRPRDPSVKSLKPPSKTQ